MSEIHFTPPQPQDRGLFFRDLLCFDKTTPADAAKYLLGQPITPSIHSGLVFQAAVNTVYEGLLERLVLPCLSDSTGFSFAALATSDFTNPTASGDLPSFIQPTPSFSEAAKRNQPSFASSRANGDAVYLSLVRWIDFVQNTFDFLKDTRPYAIPETTTKVFPPCVYEEPGDEEAEPPILPHKRYNTTEWAKTLDLSDGQPMCAREMLGYADTVAEAFRALMVTLQMDAASVTMPTGALTLFKPGGAVKTAFPDWNPDPLIATFPNGEDSDQVPPDLFRASLDILWACQAVLGHMATTFAKIPIKLHFLHEDKTITRISTLTPEGYVNYGTATTTVKDYPENPDLTLNPPPDHLIFRREMSAGSEIVVPQYGMGIVLVADASSFGEYWYPVRPDTSQETGSFPVRIPSVDFLRNNFSILTGSCLRFWNSMTADARVDITQTATVRKPKSTYYSAITAPYPNSILQNQNPPYYENHKCLIGAKREPYENRYDIYHRLVRGDEKEAPLALGACVNKLLSQENLRLTGFDLTAQDFPDLSGVRLGIEWDEDFLAHYATLTEGRIDIYGGPPTGIPQPGFVYFDQNANGIWKNMFVLAADIVTKDGRVLTYGQDAEFNLATDEVDHYINQRMFLCHLFTATHMFDGVVSGLPSATSEQELITPSKEAMLGIDWNWKSLPTQMK